MKAECEGASLGGYTPKIPNLNRKPSNTRWQRDFVRGHPAYKKDSIVSQEVAYDLMKACADIGEGRLAAPELIGNVIIDPVTSRGAYEVLNRSL